MTINAAAEGSMRVPGESGEDQGSGPQVVGSDQPGVEARPPLSGLDAIAAALNRIADAIVYHAEVTAQGDGDDPQQDAQDTYL